jgi:predicted ArsR family transcriptional regulator
MARLSEVKLTTFSLPYLKAHRGATAKEVGITPVQMHKLTSAGLVKPLGKRASDKRGRPAHEYALTDKGRKRASRMTVYTVPTQDEVA